MRLEKQFVHVLVALFIVSIAVAQSNDWSVIKSGLDKFDVGNANQRVGLDNQSIELAKETIEELDIITQYRYQEGNTIVKHSLFTKATLKNFAYVLWLPKCFAVNLDSVDFDNMQFEIIEEDPVVKWHEIEVKGFVEYTYETTGQIDPICIEQIVGVPYAEEIVENQPKDKFKNIIIVLALILGEILLVLFIVNLFFKSYKNYKNQKSQ